MSERQASASVASSAAAAAGSPASSAPGSGSAAEGRSAALEAAGFPARVPWRAVGVYVVVALAAAWLVCLPLWLQGGDVATFDPVAFQFLALGMMTTPTIAALLVVFAVQRVPRGHRVRALGLGVLPVGRTIGFAALGVAIPVVIYALGAVVASVFGFATLAPFGGEGIREQLLAVLPAEAAASLGIATMPGWLLSLSALAQSLASALTLATVSALGEEIGWRGWLLPSLRPLGLWPAIALSGALWGVWHAPLILAGYNFQDRTIVGLLLMVGMCVAIAPAISWVRLRSGSVFPAAYFHGSFNAFALSVFPVMVAPGGSTDTRVVVLGWTMWVAALVVGVALWLLWGRPERRTTARARPAR